MYTTYLRARLEVALEATGSLAPDQITHLVLKAKQTNKKLRHIIIVCIGVDEGSQFGQRQCSIEFQI